jgi:hypothetical protein
MVQAVKSAGDRKEFDIQNACDYDLISVQKHGYYMRNYISTNNPLPNIVRVVKSRRMRWAVHVARMGEGRVVHRVLVRKTKGKRPLGRPRRGWEDNIKMDLQEVGGGCGDWMELAQDRKEWRALVGAVMKFRVPKMRVIS